MNAPSRRVLCDWASVSSKVETQAELEKLLETTRQTISEAVGRHERVRLRSSGNFLDGEKWEKFGCQLKWSSATAADLIGADYLGRCVNTVNVCLSGGTGIGSLPISSGLDLLSQLNSLGFKKICRLDLSVDVFNHPELRTRTIADRLQSGDWKIPRRSPKAYTYQGPLHDIPGEVQGATLYVGKRGSDVQVAIYDKGLEQELDQPWLRLEARLRGEQASEAFYRLQQASDSAFESTDVEQHIDRAVIGVVRSVCDIRDVTKYQDQAKLPKNWASDELTSFPEIMHPVFAETAPIQVGSFKAINTFASRTRHLMRTGAKHMWRLAVISFAKGEHPGSGFLTMGAPGAHSINDEDFKEMSQVSGFTIKELEAAELLCHTALLELHGAGVECVGSDRTELRESMARKQGPWRQVQWQWEQWHFQTFIPPGRRCVTVHLPQLHVPVQGLLIASVMGSACW